MIPISAHPPSPTRPPSKDASEIACCGCQWGGTGSAATLVAEKVSGHSAGFLADL